jgi:hypothetical protein
MDSERLIAEAGISQVLDDEKSASLIINREQVRELYQGWSSKLKM